MKRCVLSFLVVGGALGAQDTAEPAYPGAAWSVATPESQGVEPVHLAQAVAQIAAVCGNDGNRQTVVVRNGRIIWQGDDVEHRHLVWSCTKSFMSTCLGLLWDDGLCTPDTLAADAFPSLATDYPTITLEHLATFTSGYNHAADRPLEPAKPLYRPGEAYCYSAQADLLAAVLTRIAGEPLSDLFMRRIGGRIGLTEESFHWGVQPGSGTIAVNGGSGSPVSGVEITATGMARLGWLYCQGGNWAGEQLISKRYIDYATTVRVPANVPPFDPKAWYNLVPGRYGMNWWVNGVNAHGNRLWPSAPPSTFALQGNRNNICIIVPEWNLVVVRLGDDKIIDIGLFDASLLYLAEGMRAAGGLPR
jgi:CubicO group peptidase (beta-lactamase class C family)